MSTSASTQVVFSKKKVIDFDNDGDVLKEGEDIGSIFTEHYTVETEVSVSMSSVYVLHICGSGMQDTKVAVALSDFTCNLYDLPGLTKVNQNIEHDGAITGIKFDPTNGNILYSSSLDATLKLWDLRTGTSKCMKEFKEEDKEESVTRPITCFDISCNGNFLCGGTELVDGDAFLLFWDARADKLLGGYWESHTDDITQVLFSYDKQDTLVSGSTDGLINVFDISESCEDDALMYTLNTECSVAKLGWWRKNKNTEPGISCISDMEELQLWDVDGASAEYQFCTDDIATALRRKCPGNCYLVDVHQKTESDELILLAGSTDSSGKCLRRLQISEGKLIPKSCFLNNKQVVRTSWHYNDDVLITGGEGGFVSIWKHGSSNIERHTNTKIKPKLGHNKQYKPY